MLYTRTPLYAALVSACLINTPQALAQGSDRSIEEIIVTAQKRLQTLKEVPNSVAALSDEYLERTNTTNFNDIGKIASGIEIGGGADGFGRNIRIRGVGTNKYVAAVSPSVGVFIDDVPLVDVGVAFTNLAGIERIEVLKGPQSTLFGKGVASGAISITTKTPETDVLEGYVEANIGNLGLQEYRVGGNAPLGDTVAVRADVYTSERDGVIKNAVYGNEGISRDNWGGRLRLAWDATDTLQFVLGYQRHELESNGTDAVIESYGNFVTTLADADPDVTLISGDPFDRVTQDSSVIQLDTETEISSLHINGEINDEWSFASVTAYQEFSQGNARSRRAENSGDTIISPLVFNHFNTQSDRDSFSQELRFNYDGDDWISTFGAFYADTSAETITPLTITSFLLLGEPQRIALLSQFDQNTEEWAIFSNSTYNINDRWDVTFGLRYAEVDKSDYSATQIGVGKYADLQSIFVPIVSRWDVPEQATKWDAITGGLKFTYDINDEVTLYFGYDRGFKAGGHDTANHDLSDPTGNSSIISPAFDEEYGDNYEIGLKGIFLDRTLSWNGSMFYQIYSDYQVNIPDPITTFKTVNAAEVVVQGIEMDFQWLLGEHFTLDGNMAYTDSRYDSYEDAGCNTPQYTASQCTVQPDGTATQDLSGKRLNLVSPWTANLNASWNDQFSNGLQWFARAEWAFRDDRIASPDLNPETTMGAYSLFNASFGLLAEDERWSATLWGKNLLDEEYLVSYEGNTDGDVIEGFRVIVGDERTYGITLSYRFD